MHMSKEQIRSIFVTENMTPGISCAHTFNGAEKYRFTRNETAYFLFEDAITIHTMLAGCHS